MIVQTRGDTKRTAPSTLHSVLAVFLVAVTLSQLVR